MKPDKRAKRSKVLPAARPGGVIELDGAEQVAMIGHGDGGQVLLGHQVMSWVISQAPSSSE
jgi:hypothetical protein